MQNAIEIADLNKTYRESGKAPEKIALKNVSLSVPRGSIFGLLGPNGAGKSTLINIMAGLVVKTSGHVRICGLDIDQNPRNARAAIGVVPQEINFDPFFTPRRSLDIQAGLYGVPKEERRTEEILDLVGLQAQGDSYTRSLSGGMKRRLMVAKALVHNPPVLVLDEPTAGVDVELRRMLWERVRMLNAHGVTVLLTTHYLEEAQALCDRIAIIHRGKIVADESKDSLLARIDTKEIRFRLDREINAVPETLDGYQAALKNARTLTVRYAPQERPAGEIIAAVQNAGLGIADISTEESDLEDIFLQLTRNE